MQYAKDGRDEEQGCDCRYGQSANHGSPEWSILFAAFAEGESHWHHANDHGERRHSAYWAKAGEARFEGGRSRIETLQEAFAGKAYQ